jgi:hypothetical protein
MNAMRGALYPFSLYVIMNYDCILRFCYEEYAEFWDMASYSLVNGYRCFTRFFCLHVCQDDGGSGFLRNVDTTNYTASHSRRPASWHIPMRTPNRRDVCRLYDAMRRKEQVYVHDVNKYKDTCRGRCRNVLLLFICLVRNTMFGTAHILFIVFCNNNLDFINPE